MALTRRKPDKTAPPMRSALTAAAARIDLTKVPKIYAARATKLGDSASWQGDAWAFYDSTPEVRFGVEYVANALSKLRLFAATYPVDPTLDATKPVAVDDEASGVPPDVAAAAIAEVDGIVTRSGGQAELIKGFTENVEVVGEVYLVYWAARPLPGDDPQADPTPPYWEVHSRDELRAFDDVNAPGGRSLYVRTDPNMEKREDMRRLVPEQDVAVRMWAKHPRWSGLSTSHMQACLNNLALLSVLNGQKMAEAMSRHNAGILKVPAEAEVDSPVPAEPPADGDAPPESFAATIGRALLEPITDPSSPAAVVPTIVKAAGDALAGMGWIDLSRKDDGIDGKITAELVRFSHGVNLPPEVIEGHMQTTFANAEQIDQDTFDDYLDPRARFMAQAWTYALLSPALLTSFPDRPDDVRSVFIWFDSSPLIGTPDPAESATDLWDRGVIKDSALRKVKGYTEADAPDDLERLTRMAFKGVAQPTPEVVDAIFNMVGIAATPPPPPEPAALPAPAPAASAPTAEAQAAAARYLAQHPEVTARLRAVADVQPRGMSRGAIDTTSTVAAGRRRVKPLGERLLSIDVQLRTRLLTAASLAMERAIEKATNRARSTAQKRSRSLAADADPADLLEGAWDSLEEKFMAWGATAQADALDVASRVASGLSTAERTTLKARQAGDLEEGWAWMERTLTHLARAELLDPAAITAPVAGEADIALRVPPGIVRAAMAKVGGATGLQITRTGGVFLPLASGGRFPAGGVGTGELITDTLAEQGVKRQGYAWVYGPARRTHPFDPHVELDGVEFENFDDAVLANDEGWPEFGFYMPGDHDGCLCDYEPIYLTD